MATQTEEKGILSYFGDLGKYIANTTGEYLKPTLTTALEIVKEEKKRLIVPTLLALGLGLPGFAYGVGLEAFGSVAKKTCETGAAYTGVIQDAGKYEAVSGEKPTGFTDLSTNLRRAGKMGELEKLAKEISEATKTKISPSQAYYLDQENKRKAEMERNPNVFLNLYAQKVQLEERILFETDKDKKEAMTQAIKNIETTIQCREVELSKYLGKEYVTALQRDALARLNPLQNPKRTYSKESETTPEISETKPAEEETTAPKNNENDSEETYIPRTQEEKRPGKIRGLFKKIFDAIKIDPEKESREYARQTEERNNPKNLRYRIENENAKDEIDENTKKIRGLTETLTRIRRERTTLEDKPRRDETEEKSHKTLVEEEKRIELEIKSLKKNNQDHQQEIMLKGGSYYETGKVKNDYASRREEKISEATKIEQELGERLKLEENPKIKKIIRDLKQMHSTENDPEKTNEVHNLIERLRNHLDIQDQGKI